MDVEHGDGDLLALSMSFGASTRALIFLGAKVSSTGVGSKQRSKTEHRNGIQSLKYVLEQGNQCRLCHA